MRREGLPTEVGIRRKVARLGAYKRASDSVSQVGPIARDVCMEAGSCRLLGSCGAHVTLKALRDCPAPNALDGLDQEAVRFLHLKHMTETAEEYLVKFDLSQR